MTTILALGADIKTGPLISGRGGFIQGPDTGDLADAANFNAFRKSVNRLIRTSRTVPQVIACDLHPGYFSSGLAAELCRGIKGSRLLRVQHHHAHIASVMWERGVRGPVIGVSFDGTGYGADGNMWGGEFLIVDGTGFRRAAHLKYRMMPGGDIVVREPWRMALSFLGEKGACLLEGVKAAEIKAVLSMMARGVNSPLSSSAGRMFDAAAALTGVCGRASYEAEGPIRLEALREEGGRGAYDFGISRSGDCYIIDTDGIFRGIAGDVKKGVSPGRISAKFHNSAVAIIIGAAGRIRKRFGVKNAVLSGGVFQNKFLMSGTVKKLGKAGFKVYANRDLPANDLNIAAGQFFVAQNLLRKKKI
ncbi:MAG: hypothetical protein ABH885_04185 [Candidatus Omnitrophota bacterium]